MALSSQADWPSIENMDPPHMAFLSLLFQLSSCQHIMHSLKNANFIEFHFTINFRGSMQARAAHKPANAARRDIAFPPMECKTSDLKTPLLRKQDTIMMYHTAVFCEVLSF